MDEKNPPKDFIESLNEQEAVKKQEQDKKSQLDAINKAGIKNVEASNRTTDAVNKGTKDIRGKVEVTNNEDLAKSSDMNNVQDSIRDLNLTTFMSTKGYHDMAQNIAQVHSVLKNLQDQYEKNGLPDAANVLGGVVDKIGQLVKSVTDSKVTLDTKLQKTLGDLSKQIDSIDFNPTVNVSAPQPKVVTTPIDLNPVVDAINKLQDSYDKLDNKDNEIDFTPILQGLDSVQSAIANQKFPVANYILPFKDSSGKATQVQLDASGNVPTSGGGGGGGTVNQGNTVDAAPVTQSITVVDSGSSSATGANNQSIVTGSATANSTAAFTLAGYDTVRVQVTGTWTGTLTSEISIDGGITWIALGLHQGAYTTSTFTANFVGGGNVAGATNYRVRATAAWTGTATVKIVETVNPSSVYIANNLKLADGTTPSTTATVKPASTAPIATDTALVVAMSPNSINNTLNAELGDFTGTITNATQTTPVVATGLAGYDNVFISINGTYTGATAIFQGSDDGGTTWYNTNVAARVDTPIIEGGYTNLSSVSRGWNLNIQGFDSVRVNPSAVATGTVNVRISAESAPTNAGATVGVASLGDGTNNINVLKSDGTAAGQNAELVAPAFRELTGLTAGSLNADLVPSTDISNTPFVALSILASAYSGTLTFQGSNDNFTTVHAVPLTRMDSTTSGTSGSTSANSLAFGGYVGYRYFRVRMTAYVSGTAQGVLELKTLGSTLGVISNQGGTWTVGSNSATGSAAPANAFFVGGSDGTNLQPLRVGLGDGSSATQALNTALAVFNNTTNDRMRNNTTAALIAAGTTSTQTGITLVTYNASRAVFLVNIASGAGTVSVAINETSSSGYSTNILTSTALVGVGVTTLRIFPAATPTANLVANDMVPRNISVTATVVGTISYGIDVNLGR